MKAENILQGITLIPSNIMPPSALPSQINNFGLLVDRTPPYNCQSFSCLVSLNGATKTMFECSQNEESALLSFSSSSSNQWFWNCTTALVNALTVPTIQILYPWVWWWLVLSWHDLRPPDTNKYALLRSTNQKILRPITYKKIRAYPLWNWGLYVDPSSTVLLDLSS